MHIEITNICNLKCTFCPPKIQPNGIMSLEKFDDLNNLLFTNESNIKKLLNMKKEIKNRIDTNS